MTKAGAKPAGLFAQTSMRIEKGFCAMGHELDSDVTPVRPGWTLPPAKRVALPAPRCWQTSARPGFPAT